MGKLLKEKPKRNAKGGYVYPVTHAPPDTLPREAYGQSYQCPPNRCGHRLTEAQWNPSFESLASPLCRGCGEMPPYGTLNGPDRLCGSCNTPRVKGEAQ